MDVLGKIYELYNNQLRFDANGRVRRPNVVYLGHDDYYELMRSTHAEVDSCRDTEFPTVFSMALKRVDECHYIAVGKVYEGGEGE